MIGRPIPGWIRDTGGLQVVALGVRSCGRRVWEGFEMLYPVCQLGLDGGVQVHWSRDIREKGKRDTDGKDSTSEIK